MQMLHLATALYSCLGCGKRMVHAGASSRKKRSRNQSGAKAKSFTEGWVEFEDKRVAKQVNGFSQST